MKFVSYKRQPIWGLCRLKSVLSTPNMYNKSWTGVGITRACFIHVVLITMATICLVQLQILLWIWPSVIVKKKYPSGKDCWQCTETMKGAIFHVQCNHSSTCPCETRNQDSYKFQPVYIPKQKNFQTEHLDLPISKNPPKNIRTSSSSLFIHSKTTQGCHTSLIHLRSSN